MSWDIHILLKNLVFILLNSIFLTKFSVFGSLISGFNLSL